MPVDFTEIAELVQWADGHHDPDAAMRELSKLDRATRPEMYEQLDDEFIDVDDDVAPEEDVR